MENQQLAGLGDMSPARLQQYMEAARSADISQILAATIISAVARLD
jgi:hypothetical protein